MSDYSVEIVIDREVMDNIVDRTMISSFLIYCLNEMETKAVILLKHWKKFFEEWEEKLKDSSDEIRQPFFAFIRGIITPYRKKYGIEAGLNDKEENNENDDDITASIKIVNRHYATLKYFIVGNPKNIAIKKLK